MVHGRDLGDTRGVGRVLGLWVLQKVSEMERNQIRQFVNFTDVQDLLGLIIDISFAITCVN